MRPSQGLFANGSTPLFVDFDTLFTTQLAQLVDLAAHLRGPGDFGARQFARAGGLMSYGNEF